MAWDDCYTARDYDHYMGYDEEPEPEEPEAPEATAEDDIEFARRLV